jgi:dTDP-4-dehydrorhamnose reductase
MATVRADVAPVTPSKRDPAPPGRVLVLGGTGMLGHACVAGFEGRFDVHATVRDRSVEAAHGLAAEVCQFDVWSNSVDALLEQVRPDVVVNCIGLVKQLDEANRPRAAVRLNALFPHELAEACAERGVRLIHISTDCVFSGNLPLGSRYREDASPDPTDLYGRSKLLGEVGAPGLTVRTSIIGPELERRSGLLEWFRAQDGGTVTGYTQAVFSGLTTAALAELLAEVIERHPDLHGLYHVAAEPITKYDLLLGLREALALDCEIEPAPEPVVNRALDGSRFTSETGIRIPSWDEMITALAVEVSHDVATT